MAEVQNAASHIFNTEYIRDLRAGNTATVDHFVSYFRPRLRSLLRRRGAPVDEVEDLQQETIMRVLVAIRSSEVIRYPERFGGFVKSVCTNTLMEQYRSRKRHTLADEWMLEIPDATQDPYAKLLARETGRTVLRTISQLSTRDQRVLHTVFVEQKSKAEVCNEFRITGAHLRLLVHRAKRRLRDHLNADGCRRF